MFAHTLVYHFSPIVMKASSCGKQHVEHSRQGNKNLKSADLLPLSFQWYLAIFSLGPCIINRILLAKLVVQNWDLSLVICWELVKTFVTGPGGTGTTQFFFWFCFSCETHFKIHRSNLGRIGYSSTQFWMYTFIIKRSLLRNNILRVSHIDSLQLLRPNILTKLW